MKPLKQKVSVTLDEDVIEHARLLAEACERSFSQYVNLVLRDALSEQSSEAEKKSEKPPNCVDFS